MQLLDSMRIELDYPHVIFGKGPFFFIGLVPLFVRPARQHWLLIVFAEVGALCIPRYLKTSDPSKYGIASPHRVKSPKVSSSPLSRTKSRPQYAHL